MSDRATIDQVLYAGGEMHEIKNRNWYTIGNCRCTRNKIWNLALRLAVHFVVEMSEYFK